MRFGGRRRRRRRRRRRWKQSVHDTVDERVVRRRVSTRERRVGASREGQRETNEPADGLVVDSLPVPVLLARSVDERARGEFRFRFDESGRRE